MKKAVLAAMMILLASCSKEPAWGEPVSQTSAETAAETAAETTAETTAQTSEAVTTAQTENTEILDTVAPPEEYHIASEPVNPPPYSLDNPKEVMEFLSEKQWYLTDRNTGEDYARLTVLPDGNITVERLDSGIMCSGSIVLKKQYSDEVYDFFELNMHDLSEDFMPDSQKGTWQVPTEDTADYMFCIGTGGGEDYMTMREIGNGMTFTGMFVFPPQDEEDPLYGGFDYLLHRQSSYTVPEEPVKESEFYAYCWKRGYDGVWFEPMTPNEKESYTDYTDQRYTSASFIPNDDHRIVKMQVADTISEEDFLWSENWESAYPMSMYRLLTDERGMVYSMKEVDTSFYGLYDLGKLPPETAYNGTRFVYNHTEYDLADEGFLTNQILNIRQADNRLVIEGHINPDKSEYIIFNMDILSFEKPVYGTNLVWQSDDVRSCVYSDGNTVRDYRGNAVYTCDNDIYLLEITDGDKLEITCFDADKNADDNRITIPYPECYDAAMYAYSDFLDTKAPSDWYRFMEYAPQNAAMFVITDPEDKIISISGNTVRESFAGNTHSIVAAVPLYDKAHIRMGQGDITYEDGYRLWKNIQNGKDYSADKAMPFTFYANVPEGIPQEFIYMYVDKFSVDFPIAQISGEHPQHSTFVVVESFG